MTQNEINHGAEIARQALIFATLTREDALYVSRGTLREAALTLFGPEVDARLQEWLVCGNGMESLPYNAEAQPRQNRVAVLASAAANC